MKILYVILQRWINVICPNPEIIQNQEWILETLIKKAEDTEPTFPDECIKNTSTYGIIFTEYWLKACRAFRGTAPEYNREGQPIEDTTWKQCQTQGSLSVCTPSERQHHMSVDRSWRRKYSGSFPRGSTAVLLTSHYSLELDLGASTPTTGK